MLSFVGKSLTFFETNHSTPRDEYLAIHASVRIANIFFRLMTAVEAYGIVSESRDAIALECCLFVAARTRSYHTQGRLLALVSVDSILRNAHAEKELF